MKIWQLDDQDIENIIFEENTKENLKYFMDQFQGGKPLKDRRLIPVKGVRKKKCDIVNFTIGIPVFSLEAINQLEEFLTDNVEILPLVNKEFQLFALNVINLIDCLNHEKTIIHEHAGITKYAFKQELLQNEHIFKIPEKIKTRVFVSEEFRNKVMLSKLKGFQFIEVWDSEEDLEGKEVTHQNYLRLLEKIEREKGLEFSFSEAISKIGQGKAVASGKWKMQHNDKNELFIGELTEVCTYQWLIMVYYPPVFIELKWHEVEKSIL